MDALVDKFRFDGETALGESYEFEAQDGYPCGFPSTEGVRFLAAKGSVVRTAYLPYKDVCRLKNWLAEWCDWVQEGRKPDAGE